MSEFSSKSPAALDAGVVLAQGPFHQQSEALRCFQAFVTRRVRPALSKLGATDVASSGDP